MSNQTHFPQSHDDKTHDDVIDLRFIIGLLKAHKLFITIIVLLCVLIGGLSAIIRPTMYESTALIKVSGDSNSASNLSALLGMAPGSSSGGFMSAPPADIETSLIESDYVMGAVAEELGLNIAAVPHYFPVVGQLYATLFSKKTQPQIQVSQLIVPKTLENIKFTLLAEKIAGHYCLYAPNGEKVLEGKIGEIVISKNQHFPISINVAALSSKAHTSFIVKKKPLNIATNDLLKHLAIKEQGERTGILQVSYQSNDPDHSQQVLNAILAVAVEKNIAEKAEEATKTLNFLKEQLPNITQNLDSSENRLNTYRSKMGVFDSKIDAEILLAEMVDLQKNINQLNLKKLEMLGNFTAKHPYIIAINKKQEQLQENFTQIEAQLKELPLNAQQTLNFERDIKVNSEIYSSIMQKIQQMLILQGSTVSSVRILDHASYPAIPLPSKTALILFVSLIAGMFLSIFILLFRHMLSNTLDPLRLEKYFGVHVLGIIPFSLAQKKLFTAMKKKKIQQENYLLCLDQPKDISIEALRSLRTALKLMLLSTEKNKNIIALSGCSPSIGKSFVSSNITSLLSDLGEKVLLIDADMRKGYLHKIFSLSQSLGLSEYLNGQISLEKSIQKALPNVDVIATGAYPENPAELLMHHRLKTLVESVSEKYDIVIIDTPPILAVTDASLLLKHASIRLLIIGSGKDHLKEIERAKGVLEKSDIKLDGIICNSMKDQGNKESGGYGYNYTYHYK